MSRLLYTGEAFRIENLQVLVKSVSRSYTLGNFEEETSFKDFEDYECVVRRRILRRLPKCSQVWSNELLYPWIDNGWFDKSRSIEISNTISAIY